MMENKFLDKFNGVALIANKTATEHIVKGYRNFETQEGLVENHRFYICSISKMFTAVAINRLVDQKLIDKKEPISKYLGESIKTNDITIYHLLTHTSGLANYVMYRKELNWQKPHTTEAILKVALGKKRKFKEGTKWSYSNTGYYLLALIIEKVTGMSYEDYITKEIIEPLGMKDTGFSCDEVNLALPHIKDHEGYIVHPTLLKGAGDIISTADDMHLFARAFYEGKLISTARYKEMIKPALTGMKIKYGEGLFINEHFGVLSIGHSGSMPTGYSTQLSIYPEQDRVSIVLCNNRKCIHPLVYPDANGKYLDACLGEEVFGKKLSLWKKAYI